MKPSERIMEIYNGLVGGQVIFEKTYLDRLKTEATILFLDEQWEKEQPCEHEPTGVKVNGCDVCKKCDVIYWSGGRGYDYVPDEVYDSVQVPFKSSTETFTPGDTWEFTDMDGTKLVDGVKKEFVQVNPAETL